MVAILRYKLSQLARKGSEFRDLSDHEDVERCQRQRESGGDGMVSVMGMVGMER